MLLSEAIREGAKLRPQGFGNFLEVRGNEICTCALAAAYEAITDKHELTIFESYIPTITRHVGYDLYARYADHPIHCTRECLKDIIVDLNDREGQSREQIADWLQSIGY